MVVGLVGCGSWERYVLRDLLTLGCDVPVVARSEESTSRAREGGAAAIVADIDSLPAVEGVVVATTTSSHASVLDEVLELGVPVFCEKPLTDDPAAAVRLAERAPDRLFVKDHDRALVSIPPGVYHALKNVGDREGAFVNLPSQLYQHDDPDKYRLPLENDVIPYRLT